jgi:hypothetical protein
MTTNDFNKLVDEVCAEIQQTLKTKANQYASCDDRLSNFKDASKFLGCNDEQALWGFVTKHIIALNDFITLDLSQSKEQWLEKTGDVICYMILLRGLLQDGGRI